ncbi:MAG: dockerin type I repeat-containing protein, partial [Spirochaetales bacterium]|nr:dockerin type I repeat-containing protein [Spirochaetales bacterium]
MKKKTIFILCMTSLLCFSSVQLFAQEQGDVNLSGGVDIVDALLIAQYYVGLNPVVFADYNADVNCSGLIDIVDALLVAQYYVGLIAGFSGCPDTPQPTPDETPDPTPDPTDFPEGTPNPYTSPIPTTGPTGWGTGIPTAIPETTPLPGTLSGDCVMNPETVNVARGDGFGISVLCNTGSQKLGGYIFTVTYDPRMIIVATDIGMNGVSAGPDGFVDSVEISNVRYNYSTLVISGTDASGRGPGASIEVCIINFRAKNLGTFVANLYVTELTD